MAVLLVVCARVCVCVCACFKTNDWVQSKINFLVGPRESLLATVKRRKLAWFRHVTRHDNLSKIIP